MGKVPLFVPLHPTTLTSRQATPFPGLRHRRSVSNATPYTIQRVGRKPITTYYKHDQQAKHTEIEPTRVYHVS